jgi:hypothetical protein
MASKQTVFVVVTRDWFNHTMRQLITGTDSQSAMNAHMLIGALKDLTDPKGLWLDKIKSDHIHRKDGAPVVMDVMIPWQHVLGVGVVGEGSALPAGFTGATVLKSAED